MSNNQVFAYDPQGVPHELPGGYTPVFLANGATQEVDSTGRFMWKDQAGEVAPHVWSCHPPRVSAFSLQQDMLAMRDLLQQLVQKAAEPTINTPSPFPAADIPSAASLSPLPAEGRMEPSYTKSVNLKAPEVFDGTKKEDIQQFLDSCEYRFMAEPRAYSAVHPRLVFAGSYLSGAAAEWARPYVFQKVPTTWESFCNSMKSRFGAATKMAATERELLTLQQGNLSFSDYMTKFNTLANLLPSLDDYARKMIFRGHLNQAWRDAIIPIPHQETCSLWDFQSECIRYEEKVGHANTSNKNNTTRGSSYTPRYTTPMAMATPVTPIAAPNATSGGGVPMEIDGARHRETTCFNCFQKGHIKPQCPNPELKDKPQWYLDRQKNRMRVAAANLGPSGTPPTDEQFAKDFEAQMGESASGYRMWAV